MAWNGNNLRTLREAAGLSRRELMFRLRDQAKEAGRDKATHERTIHRWEDGETSPSADDLAYLAVALGCDVRDFFGEAA